MATPNISRGGLRSARLLAAGTTVRAAERHGRWGGVCGELAGVPEAAVRLVDLGVRELSMAPGRIPAVKERLRRWDADER